MCSRWGVTREQVEMLYASGEIDESGAKLLQGVAESLDSQGAEEATFTVSAGRVVGSVRVGLRRITLEIRGL